MTTTTTEPAAITSSIITEPVREHLEATYAKGNPHQPVTTAAHVEFVDGQPGGVELARSLGGGGTRYLTIPVDELDGLLDLLTVVRDELRDRGNVTRYVPQQTEEPAA